MIYKEFFFVTCNGLKLINYDDCQSKDYENNYCAWNQ